MAGYRYWRMKITAANGSTNVSFNELRFFNEFLQNITTGGTPIESNHTGVFNPVSKLFDGADGGYSAWILNSFPSNDTWVGYIFPNPVFVTRVMVKARESYFDQMPKNFEFQYSADGAVWTTLVSVTNQTGWSAYQSRYYDIPYGTFSGNIVENLAITDWVVNAVRCSDGFGVGHAESGGSTYSIQVLSREPCNLTLSPKIHYAWSADKQAALNDYVVPSNPDSVPHLFKVTMAGTFGSTEATWNTSGSTTQGTAVLAYVAPLVDPVTLGPKVPT